MLQRHHTLVVVCFATVALAWIGLGRSVPVQAVSRRLADHSIVGDVRYMAPSPDNQHVVFQTVDHIFSVPLTGGSAVSLADNLAQGFTLLEQYALSPDGTRLVIRGVPAGQPAQPFGLWVVPIDGGPAQLLASGALTSRDGMSFSFSPDGRHVLFDGMATGATTVELFSVLSDGSQAPIQLSLPPAEHFSAPVQWKGVPGTDRVLYLRMRDWQNAETYARANIYSVPIDGPLSAGVLINSDSIAAIHPWAYQITRDHDWIVFTQDEALYRSNLLSQNRIRLDIGGSVSHFTLNPAGDRVAYRLRHTVGGQDQIDTYTVPISGPASASVLISPAPLVFEGHSDWPVFTSDGARVTIRTALGIYVAPASGPASAAVKIADGEYWWPSPSGDEALVATILDSQTVAVQAVSTAGASPVSWLVAEAARVVLFFTEGDGMHPMGIRFTPNGDRLVFQSRNLHFFNTPVRGPIADTHDEVGDSPVPAAVSAWRVTADSTHMVYLIAGDLYAVRLGSGPLLERLQPHCQTTPLAATVAPTPIDTSPVLYLPLIGRCHGTP